MNEDIPSLLVFPLRIDNFFYPLLNIDGEEDFHHIATTPPPLLIIRDVLSATRCFTIVGFHFVLWWLFQDNGQSEMTVLHDLGATVPIRLRALV